MEIRIDMPPVTREAEATPQLAPTLGRGAEIESRVTVGVSDVVAVEPGLLEQAQADLDSQFLRVSMRVSLRPAPEEEFERVVFAVLLQPRDHAASPRPIARALAPSRLSSGVYTVQSGLTLGIRAGAPGVQVSAETSESRRVEIRPPYVVSAGDGESDPEWRYRKTETVDLEGSYEMSMVVQVRRDMPAEAFISLAGTVVKGRQRTDVTWQVDDDVARVSLHAG